ncbi:MAG: hypothetical protein M5U34_07780 [Chloroflexi bacterium]|nr:hypothetical protein [Chloroflexota bacterium]
MTILTAMAADMAAYLQSEVLFWNMGGSLPMLTLGGYLMRQYRLRALSSLLSEEKRVEMETAVSQFNMAVADKIVRLENKAHIEIDARIRQFEAYLQELRTRQTTAVNYGTAVEPRAMLSALTEQLSQAPYQMQPQVMTRIGFLDKNLRQRWTPGEFVWPTLWQPAYPADAYWWLYGHPE